jgi:hypothetical protein
MNTPTEEKPTSRKKVWVILGIIVMGAIIIVAVVGEEYHPSHSPYVEVHYKTFGWYYTYPLSENKSCVVLNVTVTNRGYTEGVYYYFKDWDPLSFTLKIGNVSGVLPYQYSIWVANSSSPSGHNTVETYFSYPYELLNGTTNSGTIVFLFPKQLYNQTFTFGCSMGSMNYVHKTVSIRISEGYP